LVEAIVDVKALLALNIRIIRKKWGFSQEKLAEASNLSAQSISDIEGCRTWVSSNALERIAKALDVDIYQLFIPSVKINGYETETILYNRLMRLRNSMKEDIDKRLDQFYISEKSFSQ